MALQMCPDVPSRSRSPSSGTTGGSCLGVTLPTPPRDSPGRVPGWPLPSWDVTRSRVLPWPWLWHRHCSCLRILFLRITDPPQTPNPSPVRTFWVQALPPLAPSPRNDGALQFHDGWAGSNTKLTPCPNLGH